MDLGLKGLNAIITGGSKGIGRRAADIFADEGANVSVCARTLAEVNETATSLAQKGVKSLGRMVNVAEKASLEGWVRESAAALGGVDIVVANVSALAVGDNEDAWKSGFDVDIMHTVRMVTAALPLLEKSSHGAIVIVSSVSGREVDFTGPAYGAFKAALVHYSQRLAQELAPKNIRVNSVSPGNTYFKGGVWENIEQNMPDLYAQAIAHNPTGRMATPEEVARGIVFLASPASSFTMGTNLVIDGALTRGVQL